MVIWGVEFTYLRPKWLPVDSKQTGRRKTGLKYEEYVHEEFGKRYPSRYVHGPWVLYRTRGGPRWCQPDGLLIDPWLGRLTVIEVKLQHTNDACRKLFEVYVPVMQAALGGLYEVIGLEVVRWYDVAVPCSKEPALCADPLKARPERFNVHIWEGF